jgi:putative transposase
VTCNAIFLDTKRAKGPRHQGHKAWHDRGYLPHFDSGAAVQMITFRLADSLPREIFRQIVANECCDEKRRRRTESMIDEGRGHCVLRDRANALLVQEAFEYFDGERYRLIAWVVMPNHVHVLIEQIEGFRLGEIVRLWKSFTAKKINERTASKGSLWARDYFDRFIRNEEHFENAIAYIELNPVKAGLVERAQDWVFSSHGWRAERA